MLGLLALCLLLAPIVGVRVHPAGPGHAIYIGMNQSLYIPDFPMSTEAVTVELWSRPLQVQSFSNFTADYQRILV